MTSAAFDGAVGAGLGAGGSPWAGLAGTQDMRGAGKQGGEAWDRIGGLRVWLWLGRHHLF